MGKSSGGGSSTTTTALDPQVKAAILPAISRSAGHYKSGLYDQVADQGALKGALSDQAKYARQIADEGLGIGALRNQLANEEGRLLAGQQGALGSARGDRAREGALLDKELQLGQADLEARRRALSDITGAQQGQYDLEQFRLEAPLRGTERFFGALSGAPQGSSTTTKSSGGGKK